MHYIMNDEKMQCKTRLICAGRHILQAGNRFTRVLCVH